MFGLVGASGFDIKGLKLTQASSKGGETTGETYKPKGEGAKANAQKRVKLCDPNFGTYPIENILDRKSKAFRDRHNQTYTAVLQAEGSVV